MTGSGPQEVDLDETDAAFPQLALLLSIQVAAFAGMFIRGAQDFDDGDHLSPATGFANLNKPFRHFLVGDVDHKRFGHNEPA